MRQQIARLFISFVIFLITVAVPISAFANSLILNPKAEAEVQQNKQLDSAVASPTFSDRLKSPKKAFFFSAVLPGMGELYSRAKRGVIFTAAEVSFWTAYIVIHGQAEDLEDDYINFVDKHIVFEEDSPVCSTESWTLEDYEHATQTDNWHYVYTENNGKPLERVGEFYWDDLPEDMIDQPGKQLISKSRAEAFKKRGTTNDKFKQAKVFLGLVIINHIVSAIDSRIAATMYNNRISRSGIEVSFHPTVSSNFFSLRLKTLTKNKSLSGYPGVYIKLQGRL